jgi:S-adenosylmethionine hydrolase
VAPVPAAGPAAGRGDGDRGFEPGPSPTVTLLSDYGTVDGYVGIVHSVIRRLAPGAGIVDLTHQIPPFDIRAGAIALWRGLRWAAPGVLVAIVDPGVATSRRAVAIEVCREGPPEDVVVLIGPDNGLLAPAAYSAARIRRAVELTNPRFLETPSVGGATFAGRDVFAPAAAHLCRGVDLEALGELIDPAGLIGEALGAASSGPDGVEAAVIWIDRFGNLTLNVDVRLADSFAAGVELAFADGRQLPARRVGSFAELGPDEIGVIGDSDGCLAICVNRGSAARRLSRSAGDLVRIRPLRPMPG